MSTARTLSQSLDRIVRPTIDVHRRSLSAFQVCGVTGLALAVLLALGLVSSRGLSPWVMAALVGTAVATFFVVAFATKIVRGEEQLVYYHHELAVMGMTAVALSILRQPVLAYLDATILGVGLFLACGRVGCFMVGCCHGRPHRWGVCYGHDHAQAGFPTYLVGVRLFPIQLVEALLAATIVAVGSAMVLRGQPAGSALAWYVVAYDVGRFCLEFRRGDPGRPYYRGFSEAQWISLALTWAVVVAGALGILPAASWHVVAAAALTGLLLGVALKRRRDQDEAARLAGAPADIAEQTARPQDGGLAGRQGAVVARRAATNLPVAADTVRYVPGALRLTAPGWDEQRSAAPHAGDRVAPPEAS